MERLRKRGKLVCCKDGDLTLVNNKLKSYPVDERIVSIWNRFDGNKSINEIAQEVSKEDGVDLDSVIPEIRSLITAFHKIDLIC